MAKHDRHNSTTFRQQFGEKKLRLGKDIDVLVGGEGGYSPPTAKLKKVKVKDIKEKIIDANRYKVPTYQRQGDVWPVQFRQDLIASLMLGATIPSLKFCRTGRVGSSMNVMDGFQRLTALILFFNDDFHIDIQIDNKMLKAKWSLIESEPALIELKNAFLDAEMTYFEYNSMPLIDQARCFDQMNNANSLSSEERRYSRNMWTRKVIQWFMEETQLNQRNLFSKNTESDKRLVLTKYAHEVMVCLFGNRLDGDPMPRSLRGNILTPSAKYYIF